MQKVLLICVVFISSMAAAQSPGIYINEFQALNASTIRSVDFFEYNDWIELYNDENYAVNIGNYCLTDDLSDSFRYEIPPYTFIEPKSYLLFWADGRDYVRTGYHTNFRLGDREEIGLYNAEGVLIDSVRYPDQISDFSYGRQPDATGQWVYFDQPTPRETNSTAGAQQQTEPPQFSVHGGFFNAALSIELNANAASSDIFYTVDGSVPDNTSIPYTGAIDIDESKVIRARVYRHGFLASKVITHTYIIGQRYGLPVISLSTDPLFLFDDRFGIYVDEDLEKRKDWERLVHLQFFDTNGDLQFDIDAGMRLFGRTAMYLPQKSLAIFMRRKYGTSELNYPLFPDLDLDTFESFILRSSSDDWELTLFRDAMIHTLIAQNFNIDTQAYRPCIVFLNGEFWGIHNIREKYNEYYLQSHHDVDADQLDIVFNNLLKGVNSIQVLAGDSEKYSELILFIQQRKNPVLSDYRQFQQLLNVDNYIDYCIAQMFSANIAWRHNRKLWRPKTANGRFQWIFYDLDRGYKVWDRNTLEDMFYSDPVFQWLCKIESFKHDFIGRYASHINISLTTEKTLKHIDSLKSNIEAEIPKHLEKWQAIGSVERWQEKVEDMREFARKRPAFARGDINNVFDLDGTCELAVLYSNAAAGNIYVHGLAVPADSFNGTFYKNIPIQLKAVPDYGYRFSHWQWNEQVQDDSIAIAIQADSQIKAVFEPYTSEFKLVITEIHYHPALVGENNNSYEFIEIYNTGKEPVQLAGTAFTSGIEFVFPEGAVIDADEYIVLARDSSYYSGQGYQVLQWSSGNLSNGGEWLRFEDGNGNPIDSVEYDDDSPWPAEADGAGPSLALKDPYLDNSKAENWSAGVMNGSPGKANSNTILDLPPVIHFVRQNPISPTTSKPVRIYAKAEDDQAIAGLTLHFDAGLGQNQLAMHDDGLHGDVAANDSIYGVVFPELENNTVVKYYVCAQDRAGQTAVYPETAPDVPALFKVEDDTSGQSDIVISEIMYHSAGQDTEWVEICNRGLTPRDLGYWIFQDDNDSHRFRLPQQLLLQAGECLVICMDTSALKIRYGLHNLVGNFDFGLGNGDDQVRLFNANRVLIDSVAYTDESPWPVDADGEGYSLDLIDLFSDNAQPQSWQSSARIGGSPGTRPGYTLAISSQPDAGGYTEPAGGNHFFDRNSRIPVKAKAKKGYHFYKWEGPVLQPDSAVTAVRMDTNKTITAFFKPDTFTLSIAPVPEKGGEVNVNPDKAVYQYGDTVWVEAKAADAYFFTGWVGLMDSLRNPQMLVMKQNSSLQALFARDIKRAPRLDYFYPAAGALQVPQNPVIRFRLQENQSGIEPDSVSCYINSKPCIVKGNPVDSMEIDMHCADNVCSVVIQPQALLPFDTTRVRITASNRDVRPDKLDTLIAFECGNCKLDSIKTDVFSLNNAVSLDSCMTLVSNDMAAGDTLQFFSSEAHCDHFVPDSLLLGSPLYYLDPFGYRIDLNVEVKTDSATMARQGRGELVLLFLSPHQREVSVLSPIRYAEGERIFQIDAFGYIATAFCPQETLSALLMPGGEKEPVVNKRYRYHCNRVYSSFGHPLQYRFEWGDGNKSEWSADTTAFHRWQEPGRYEVRAVARSQNDTTVMIRSMPFIVEAKRTATVEDADAIPKAFDLLPNYPNPFNPRTRIEYKVPRNSHVDISIYNVLGQKIVTLLNEEKRPGHYTTVWNGLDDAGSPVSVNIYFLIFKSADFNKMIKMFYCK